MNSPEALEVIEFIKENLRVRIDISESYDYGEAHKLIDIKLFIGEEEISSDGFSVKL